MSHFSVQLLIFASESVGFCYKNITNYTISDDLGENNFFKKFVLFANKFNLYLIN